MEAEKPVVLWLADNPNWAYASIVRQVGARLPQYEHRVAYLADGSTPPAIAECAIAGADVVVSMFLPYHELCPRKDNVALMLTGMRPFEVT